HRATTHPEYRHACGRRRSAAIDSQFQPARKRILLRRRSSTVQNRSCHDRTLTSVQSNRVVQLTIGELWLGYVPWAGRLFREVKERALHSPRGIPDSTRRYSRQEDSRGAAFVCCNRECSDRCS